MLIDFSYKCFHYSNMEQSGDLINMVAKFVFNCFLLLLLMLNIHSSLSFRLTMKGVFEAVEQRMKIQKGQGKNLYYLLQKYLILDDMESLLQDAHLWLNDGIAPHLLRCLTHVVLFLRKIGRIPQQLEPHCIDILEACVKVRKDRV